VRTLILQRESDTKWVQTLEEVASIN